MFRKNPEPTNLDTIISNLEARVGRADPISDDYTKLVDRLADLYKIRAAQQPDRVSKDAMVAVLANLTGIGLILNHERIHVITTKALGLVAKAR